MIWDPWTGMLLALTAFLLIRPVWVTLTWSQHALTKQRKQRLAQAGGGAAMFVLAIYLASSDDPTTGHPYWYSVGLAMHDPSLWLQPIVWVPVLCWILLAVMGPALLWSGGIESRGPREGILILWALNEAAICAGLLLLGAYVPEGAIEQELLNFALKGIYLSWLVGSLMRLLLVMLGPSNEASWPDGRMKRS